MPLPNFVAQTDIFFTWLDATNNLTSHVDNTSAYLLVAQNATPRTSTGNIALSGTFTLGTTVLNTSAIVANGNFLTTLNASAITTGTLPVGQLDGNVILTTSTTGINASALSTGTVPVARLDSSVILTTSTTGINASALSTGTVPSARLTSASATANGIVDTTTQTFAGNKTFNNDVTIAGTLTLIGQGVTLNTNNIIVQDSLIQLAANNTTSDALDIGLYGNYNGDGGAHEHTGLFRDATDGLWKLFVGLQDAPTNTTINIAGTGYAVGTLQTYLTSGGMVSNSTAFAVTANSSYTGTLTVNSVTAQTLTGDLTGTASNATNLNSQPGSYYTNASNITTGTLPVAQLNANVILTTATTGINASALSTGTVPLARLTSASASANGVVDTTTQTFAGDKTFQNTVILQSALTANSGNGSAGQVLTSNGAGVYWANASAGAAANTAGGTGALQFYNGTTLGADANLAFLTNTLTVNGGMTVAANANFNGGTLFVDTVNNRVGVNNTAPTQAFRVNGTTSISGNVAIGTTNTSAFALLVEGSFAATTKEFNIAHPTRPGKRLRYGVLESPYHGVRLTGRAELTGTEVEVPLPDYLSALCTDVGSQVQLTNHGHDKILWVDRIDLARNCFVVRMRRRWWDRTTYAFYWAFTGVRQDVEPLDVEPE